MNIRQIRGNKNYEKALARVNEVGESLEWRL